MINRGAKKRVGRAAIGGYLGVPCMMDLHDVARQHEGLGLKGFFRLLLACCFAQARILFTERINADVTVQGAERSIIG